MPDQNTETNVSGSSIFDKATCLSLKLSAFRTNCNASIQLVETDADRERLKLKKNKLQNETLDKINSRHQEIRNYIAKRCLPNNLFRSGTYILPDKILNDVIQYLHAQKLQLEPLIEQFMAEYEDAYANDFTAEREALQSQFNLEDYPAPAKVRRRFDIEWNIFTYDAPGKLSRLNQELFLEEQEKIREQGKQTLEELQQLMRAQFVQGVEHMLDRLTPGANGKKKIFKDSSINGFKEWIDFYEARNIADDQELSKIVELAKLALDGVDPEVLRNNEAVRSAVAQHFSEIKSIIDDSITTTGRKFFELEEEQKPAAA